MFGERRERDHPDIRAMLELATEQTALTTIGKDSMLWMWLNNSYKKSLQQFYEKRDKLLDAYLKKHRVTIMILIITELKRKYCHY